MVHSSKHLNLTSSDGYTPLHYAAVNGHTQICSLLAAQVRPFQLEISIIVVQIVLTKTQTDRIMVCKKVMILTEIQTDSTYLISLFLAYFRLR